MKNAFLFLLILILVSPGIAQEQSDSAYSKRKLSLQEINFIHSYYEQTGQNAAVDGGTGDEALTDFSNVVSVTLVQKDKKSREHTYNVKVGLDYYSSASSDRIDPNTISSASSSDVRVYPSLSWNVYNEKKRKEFGLNMAFSAEYDYTSFGLGFSYGGHSKNKNTNWIVRGQAYVDQWSLIYPIELRGREALPRSDRSSYSASFVVSQVLTKRIQMAFMADLIYQAGLLSTPYHRFYFSDQNLASLEKLPGSRLKIPLGVRFNYFVGDRVIIKTWGRYYSDDWNLSSYTAQVEIPVKINSFLSVYPFLRVYDQQAADYFHPTSSLATGTADFYTGDYDLSTFSSQFYGLGFRYAPPKGLWHSDLLKIKWSELGMRYGHYERSTGLTSNIVSLHLKLKPK